MRKVIIAVWRGEDDTAPASWQAALRGEELAGRCAAAGARRIQVNVEDESVSGAMRISHLDPPIDAVVSLWFDDDAEDVQPAVAAVAAQAARIAAWAVTPIARLDPRLPADGSRIEALANIAFLRRPADLPYDEWLRIWQQDHTVVAIETQATFGYYQNIVEGTLTDDTPHVDAIVEELFPPAAVSDPHAFYGSGGDEAELADRLNRMIASVVRFGADRDLDVVPTSRFDRDLAL